MNQLPTRKLRSLFLKLIDEYQDVYDSVKANNDWKNSFRDIVSKEIPSAISECIDLNPEYRVEGSYGKGRWTAVPWIAVFDTRITSSAQQGAYIVYLLNKDSKELYLTFEVAATEALHKSANEQANKSFVGIVGKMSSDMITLLSNKVKQIRDIVPNDYFFGDEEIRSGSPGYDAGAVYYKKYSVNTFPDGSVLIDDLERMLTVYHQYYELFYESNIWWPSLSQYDPGISKDQWLALLNDGSTFSPNAYSAIAAMYDYGGAATCKQLELQYGETAAFYNATLGNQLASKAKEKLSVPYYVNSEGENKVWPILFQGRDATPEEDGSFVWKIRPELYDALTEFQIWKYLLPVGKTGSFDSWEIIDENTAVKHCDKSFFEHNGSGVPKAIRWFFNATALNSGETVPITLLYDGAEYSGRIANNATDRVQVYWSSSLGALFSERRDLQDITAVFHKKAENVYEVELSGGEETVSTYDLIQKIKAYIASKGFSYEPGLIENFYLCLKSKPFVILAGTSGTGKTRLVKLFAEAIGATSANGRYQMVSVRPDWSDSTDLFGHMDLSSRFIPGAIIDFIKRAELDVTHPYILCLDEMNLARVEYYLSDFLSVMETRDFNETGEIVTDPLVPETCFGSDQAAKGKYGTVMLPENLYIIGTVNMDETTFPFSRKVLDRANTIEFSYVDLMPGEFAEESASALDLPNSFLKTQYLLLQQCRGQEDYVQQICADLQHINTTLQTANAHVGYRVRDEIVFYLLNNHESGLLTEEAAFDNAIMQKILPRIQGSSGSVKHMLCDLFKVCAGDYEGFQTETDDVSSRMLKAAQSPDCKHPESAKKIAFMVRRYEEDGFTSYWL